MELGQFTKFQSLLNAFKNHSLSRSRHFLIATGSVPSKKTCPVTRVREGDRRERKASLTDVRVLRGSLCLLSHCLLLTWDITKWAGKLRKCFFRASWLLRLAELVWSQNRAVFLDASPQSVQSSTLTLLSRVFGKSHTKVE